MMTSTHALVGASIGAVAIRFAPELAPIAIVIGFIGGSLPDIDLLWTHRRTTHFPVVASSLSTAIAVLALVVGTELLLLLAVFSLAVAVHSVMDAFCGGVETRPWEATSDQAVYDHVRDQWIRPRRYVRYAGAPEDFLCAVVVAVPAVVVATGRLRMGLIAVVLVSGVFVATRRRLVPLTEWLFANDK